MNSKNALVILNPKAGMKKSKKALFEIVDRLSCEGYRVLVQTTTQPGDGTRFTLEYGKNQDLIVCCGGDGTLNEVLNGIHQGGFQTPLGYVPAGTTNDFARTLNLPHKVEKCMDLIMGGYPRACDLGKFNERNFSYIASLGAFTNVSYSTPQKLKNALGHSAYVFEGIKEIGNITPFKGTIQTDKETYEGEFVFGSISNTSSIGGLFRLKKIDVRLDDGEFELMLIRNPKNLKALGGILDGLASGKYDPRYVVFTHIKSAEIHLEQPMPWTLDGESGGEQTDIKIEVLPRAFNLLN